MQEERSQREKKWVPKLSHMSVKKENVFASRLDPGQPNKGA